MTSGYTVDHATLASAGQQIAQQSSTSSSIAQQVQAAEVPTLAWGMLGMSCGLYAGYTLLLSQLDQHLTDMSQSLSATGTAMVGNAQAYQQTDQQSAETFQQIGAGTDESGGTQST